LAADLSFRLEQSKIKLSIPDGASKSGEIKIYSQSGSPISLKVYLEDWVYTDINDGSKDFYPPGSTPFSCAKWINYSPSELLIPPYGIGKVNYTVNVPKDAEGGHYAVMFFESAPIPPEFGGPEQGIKSGVGLAIRLGSLIYIEVKDKFKRSVEFNNFQVSNDIKNNYLLISADLKNTGNTDITTASSYHIIDFKGVVHARGEFNNVFMFPGDTGMIEASWKKPLSEGKYDLVITTDLGKSQEEGGVSRGPVIVKETELYLGQGGEVLKVGQLR